VRHYQDETIAMPLSDFTLFAATTDKFCLLPPLLDRFKLILQLTYYDDEALAKIIQQRAKMMKLLIDEQVAIGIAKRSKGTPRQAIRLLEACHRFTRSKGETQITVEHFDATVFLEGLDEIGLDPDEQRYLQFVAGKNGEPMRLFTAQAALGIPQRTIQANIEPFLLRENLIEAIQYGRRITQKGLEHLNMRPKLKVVR
jgi:Holliday junction DNA helicase RuvB